MRLTAVPLVPEVRLYLAQDPIILWARLEAEVGHDVPPPFWASAWAGSQALARYVLDHPASVRGRHILDLAAGSGLAGIAAARAGAASIQANDTDRYAPHAITFNARANSVAVRLSTADLLDGDGGGADVVLAGDVFYTKDMAERVHRFIDRAAARGAVVLIGDPGRAFLPRDRLETLATYRLPPTDNIEDAHLTHTHVLRPQQRAGR